MVQAVQAVTLETDSAAATERVAATLAAELGPGDIVLVSGELGAARRRSSVGPAGRSG